MARKQARLLTAVWSDPGWTALTESAQRMYLLLLSQPKLSLAGAIDLMPTRWARMAAGTTEADVMDRLAQLERARFVVVDDDEIVIRTFVEHDLASGTLNKNLVKGMWSAWAAIMSPTLRKVVVDHIPESIWTHDGVAPPASAREMRAAPPMPIPLQPQTEPQFRPQLLQRFPE